MSSPGLRRIVITIYLLKRRLQINNMADTSRLVLCDVLCFLSNKFVNTTVKVLKSTLVDFYDVVMDSRPELSEAGLE